MASLQSQLRLHEAARRAVAALESSARTEIQSSFDRWAAGELDGRTVRYALEATVRRAYRSSAAIARQAAMDVSEIPDWSPDEVFNTEYLQSLLSDVRRNLRSVKSGELTTETAISRISHSAGVGAQRGYTDQIISAFSELEDFGFQLRKYWLANFDNNVPCPACTRLHGTSVGLHENFRTETGEPGVYRDLIGPPRHPNCQCKLFIFIQTLDTAFAVPRFDAPQEAPQMVSTDDVKNMSLGIFSAIRSTLAAILAFFRRKR